MRARSWIRVLVVCAGCGRGEGPPRTDHLPWMEDDLDGALARARAEHKMVFVDVWATWCHPCVSMKAFVLEAPRPGTGLWFRPGR